MTVYRIATIDEVKYLHDAQYHADVEAIKQSVERGLLVPDESSVYPLLTYVDGEVMELMARQEFIDSLEVLDTTKVERESVDSAWFSVDPIYLPGEKRDKFRIAALDTEALGKDTT